MALPMYPSSGIELKTLHGPHPTPRSRKNAIAHGSEISRRKTCTPPRITRRGVTAPMGRREWGGRGQEARSPFLGNSAAPHGRVGLPKERWEINVRL